MAIVFQSEKARRLVEAAVKVAKGGLADHYHPSILAPVWRKASREQWARLAVLAAMPPPDELIKTQALEQMDHLALASVPSW